jgi:hypothetical protein
MCRLWDARHHFLGARAERNRYQGPGCDAQLPGQGVETETPTAGRAGVRGVMRPSFFLARPLTAGARHWLEENIEYQLIIDEAIPIDQRHFDAIFAGLEEAGFKEGIDYEVV